MEIGYIRVSSAGQHTDRQLDGLGLPPECLYIDRCSGKDARRPELQNLLKAIHPGDVVHVHSLDRLASNLADLLRILDEMTEKGGEVRFHKEKLTFSADSANPMNRLILQVFGALAEWERTVIRERQAEGIAAARRLGKPIGRPTAVTEEQREQVRDAFRRDPLYSVSRISRETGVPRSTCHDIRQKMRKIA